jgi:glutamyl-tRNA(Gln) amidotransferase subunit E
MDYKGINLTVGIEIHQELATKNKLFCACIPLLNTGEPDFTFQRKLRPSQSELGEIDPAALFEFLKGKTIIYEANHDTSCLVEMDEEPPGPLNSEALDICLIFSLLVDAKPVDEVHIMRKTVVDGSNTCGFQRTSVISLSGSVQVNRKDYRLEQICVEEDAARKIREDGDNITFRLDRLGIPLMEITTAPDIHTPEEAKAVAGRLGSLLRATGMVRRGLGTIRQDVNVSIKGGPVIEIKGVQDLNLIDTVVDYEAQRQLRLLEIADELKKRGVKKSNLVNKPVEVSEIFSKSKSKIILNALERNGKVFSVMLQGFKGLTGKELCPNRRLGTEFSDHAKVKGGVQGIFHTDENLRTIITEKELRFLREKLGVDTKDVIVIVADEEEKCKKALTGVVNRAIQALDGIPEETRSANPDGTTHYTRPRPGAARMYPETDVSAIKITPQWIDRLKSRLPEMPEHKLKRFMKVYKINEKLAKQIIDSEYLSLFEELATTTTRTTLLAVTLTEDLKKMQRDGVPVKKLTREAIQGTFKLINDGKTSKEAIPELLIWLSKNPKKSASDALLALGLDLISEEELSTIIKSIIIDQADLVNERGMRAIGPLMGILMRHVRGKVNAKDAQKQLQNELKQNLS